MTEEARKFVEELKEKIRRIESPEDILNSEIDNYSGVLSVEKIKKS